MAILFFLVFLFLPLNLWATSFVNVTSGSADGSDTSIAATAANHTTGNLLAVFYAADGNIGTGHACSDTASNTFTLINSEAHTNNDMWGVMFYAKNITGNANNVVTCSRTGAHAFRRIVVLQYSGSDAAAPLEDGSNDTAEGSGTTATATSMTSAGGAVFVACGQGYSSTTTWTPDADYTERIELSNYTYCEDRITASGLTDTPTATQTESVAWIINSAVFKDAAATRSVISVTVE